ncbi:hypothetical protein M501DRAFT_1002545 [Patellaria atrata CBS 101060]|uniref:Inner centromere protein ARK-binding domain-containing protein n=1 Tax=Patellaria atrata CBS 101060 TaxID=1346257 RepID=A0A9P4SCN6_9PEZI|nr:hypothetical protein M501DRAFT_1002545 [Patellaria atrata CBS 101060]
MASLRSKTQIGSAHWILDERQQADQFVAQEVEEFSYAVKNEMEWLNEHMTDIFNQNKLNVTDIFKTPGKLRGQTPRTVRKRNPLEARAPLTDIFAPNTQAVPSPSQKTQFYKQIAQIQVAEDQENAAPVILGEKPVPVFKSTTDSGYHGLTEDEMEVDTAQVPVTKPTDEQVRSTEQQEAPPTANVAVEESSQDERRTTDGSFHSAKEDIMIKQTQAQLTQESQENDNRTIDDGVDIVMKDSMQGQKEHEVQNATSPKFSILAETASALDSIMNPVDDTNMMEIDGVRSPSEGSSPVKPLIRKSSLTFATLPAREPITKKSMGARSSRTSHLDQTKFSVPGRSSVLDRLTGGKSLGGNQNNLPVENELEHEQITSNPEFRPVMPRVESETTKIHNKTSTQRLHERINMLGQSKEPRSSKSIPSNPTSQTSQPQYPQLPAIENEILKTVSPVPELAPVATVSVTKELTPTVTNKSVDEEEEDWIAPIKPASAPIQDPRPLLTKSHTTEIMETINLKDNLGVLDPKSHATGSRLFGREGSPLRQVFGHAKSSSASVLASPTRPHTSPDPGHKKAISVSNPNLASVLESTTPVGSPAGKRYMDGPLSASKAKLYSVLKSAKGIFASSAGVSAQAKMEAMSPSSRGKDLAPGPSLNEIFSPKRNQRPGLQTIPGGFPDSHLDLRELPQLPTATGSPGKANEPRRTRSSSEREEKRKEQAEKERLRIQDDLEKARAKEAQKAAVQKSKAVSKDQTAAAAAQPQNRQGAEIRAETSSTQEEDIASADEMPPPPPPKNNVPSTNSQKLREPRRFAKPTKQPLPQAKPAPVSIKLASQRFGHGPQTNVNLSSSLSETLPPPPPPKQSTVTTKASNASLHSAASTSSFKTANSSHGGRPKALEVAAKKREQEEKAAQKKAELKREQEQRRAAKLEEERKAERERRAAEQQRAQETKKAAQKQAAAVEAKKLEQQRNQAKSRQANDLASALQQEKMHAPPSHQRADLGAARPVSRMNAAPEPNVRPTPQINPAKPPKRMFQPDDDEPVARPAPQRNPPSFQQLDAKRRKSNEEEIESQDTRRSVMAPPIRQSNIRKETNKFTHGYMPAPPATAHNQSMFKQTVTSQHQMQQLTKTGYTADMAKFANAKIPFADGPNPAAAGPSTYKSTHKTPVRGPPGIAPTTAGKSAKSSPRYTPGETIALPEIATDSEDEDSENEWAAPSWVNSPALRELLSAQQLVDPESVFGPIAPLQMEEIFKNKERAKRFRDRGSSANWNGNDRLTEEERRKDREGRERMMREGGWTYGQGFS